MNHFAAEPTIKSTPEGSPSSDLWPKDEDLVTEVDKEAVWEKKEGEKEELAEPWPEDDEDITPDPFED